MKGRDRLAPLVEEAFADTEVPAAAPSVILGTGTVSFWPNNVTLGFVPNSAPNQPACAPVADDARNAAANIEIILYFLIMNKRTLMVLVTILHFVLVLASFFIALSKSKV
tara:strand:- start:5250 stop:5579 length:330 start_codon:yes stop_codon:yes gene_type:complete